MVLTMFGGRKRLPVKYNYVGLFFERGDIALPKGDCLTVKVARFKTDLNGMKYVDVKFHSDVVCPRVLSLLKNFFLFYLVVLSTD